MPPFGPEDNYSNNDRSPEAISHYIAEQLADFRGQEISESIIEEVRMRVAGSLGALLAEHQQWEEEAQNTPASLNGLKERSPERFNDIASRDSIIVREHFEGFAQLDLGMSKNYIRGFHRLVDGGADPTEKLVEYRRSSPASDQLYHQRRQPTPLQGLIVVRREDAYIHAYGGSKISEPEAKVLAEYGVVAGSILDTLDWLRKSPLGSQKQKTLQALQHFVITLGEQIDANDSSLGVLDD